MPQRTGLLGVGVCGINHGHWVVLKEVVGESGRGARGVGTGGKPREGGGCLRKVLGGYARGEPAPGADEGVVWRRAAKVGSEYVVVEKAFCQSLEVLPSWRTGVREAEDFISCGGQLGGHLHS